MLPVGAGDVVTGSQRAETSDRDCLLADVQMTEAPDLPQAVRLSSLFLEPADEEHLAEPSTVFFRPGGIETFGLWLGPGRCCLGHRGFLRPCTSLPSGGAQGDTSALGLVTKLRGPSLRSG